MRRMRILARVPPDTHSVRSVLGRLLHSPLALALAVTAINAAKPAVVDDAAYLAFARHIAHRPLDPYGFTIFWYSTPDPAMSVLAPPVVPYWLALGILLYGEQVLLLKLWLFPFAWMLAWSVDQLLRRFARGSALLPVIVLSPAILPAVNLMLDIPAIALGLSGVVVFLMAADRMSWRLVIAAGIVAALAMQTKYTMLLVPIVFIWFGLTRGRVRLAAVAAAVAFAAFALWEGLIAQQYGRSHFLFHAGTQTEPNPGESWLDAWLEQKSALGPGLVGHFGCLGIGVGLAAAGLLRWPRWCPHAVAFLWSAGFALVACLPLRWTVISSPMPYVTLPMVFWQFFGMVFLLAILACALVLLFRFRKGVSVRMNADSLFLVGWFAIELAGYFALTPFPAARRLIGLTVVGGLLVARLANRAVRVDPARRPAAWTIVFAIHASLAVTAIDTVDAYPEKVAAERAQRATADRPDGSTVWYAGHWGFQFYCERAGMRPLVPGQSVLAQGDYVVLPIHPDTPDFHRPVIGGGPIRPPPHAEVIDEIVWEDWLSAKTVPNFYGGINPIAGRDHPRLRVVVYRLTSEWRPVTHRR
jgi:hypothetical protein